MSNQSSQVATVVAQMRDGELSQKELDLRIAEFERDGKIVDFSKGVVNMVEQHLKNENQSNDILASQVRTMNQIIIDKNAPLAEKELAYQQLREINKQLREKSKDNARLVAGVGLLVGIIIAIGLCLYYSNNKK